MDSLKNNPQIEALLDTLRQNGMLEEMSQVRSFVDYIDGMESTLSGMSAEMQSMKEEIDLIHDDSLRGKCQNLVHKAEDRIKQMSASVDKTKNELIHSAKNAVKVFTEKGKDAFMSVMKTLRIPQFLDVFANNCKAYSELFKKDAQLAKDYYAEVRGIGQHVKNIGRLSLEFLGVKTKESETMKSDNIIVDRYSRLCNRVGDRLNRFAQKAMDKADSIRAATVKTSVSSELKKLSKQSKPGKKTNPGKDNKDITL